MKKFFNLRNLVIAGSGLAFLFGVLLAFHLNIDQVLIQNQSEKALKLCPNKQEGKFQAETIEPLTTSELLAHQFSKLDLPVAGKVTLPELHIELPVFNCLTSESMMYGACYAKAHQEMGKGNVALASHTIFNPLTGNQVPDLLFGNLFQAQIGQHIFLTDKAKVYDYQIERIFTVADTQGEIIADHKGKREITLYTCTNLTGEERLVVQGNLVRTTSY
ncbi:class A sortase [Lactococcus petauri]|uniref:class A sortase n=1 Tax=Lactococcus petauri TaxID=1940789 RepID=UPI001F588F3E|nr:class A sortase [Lactococcus petauri]